GCVDAVAEFAHVTETVVNDDCGRGPPWAWQRSWRWHFLRRRNAIPAVSGGAARSMGMIVVIHVIRNVAIVSDRVVILFHTKNESGPVPLSVLNNGSMSRVTYVLDSRVKVTAHVLLGWVAPILLAVTRVVGSSGGAAVILIDQ